MTSVKLIERGRFRRQSPHWGSPVFRLRSPGLIGVSVLITSGLVALVGPGRASALSPTSQPWQSDTCWSAACVWSSTQGAYVAGGGGVSVKDYLAGAWGSLHTIEQAAVTIETEAGDELPKFETVPGLQTITLGPTNPFSFGWKIGSTTDTKWLHLQGVGLGTTANVPAAMTAVKMSWRATGFTCYVNQDGTCGAPLPGGWYAAGIDDNCYITSLALLTVAYNVPNGYRPTCWSQASQSTIDALLANGSEAVRLDVGYVNSNCCGLRWPSYEWYIPTGAMPYSLFLDLIQAYSGQTVNGSTGWKVFGGCGDTSTACTYPGSQAHPTPSATKLRCQLSGDAADCGSSLPAFCVTSDSSGFYGGAGSTGCGLGSGPEGGINCQVDPQDYACPTTNSDGTTYSHPGGAISVLERFAPQLRLDTQENFYPDSAAEITDNYVAGQYTNRLQDANEVVLAASDPADPTDQLSLDFLSRYASVGTDYLDEADSYAADAYRMHSISSYANVIYGRVIPTANGETLVQYWIFYYYNSHPFGDHEGDWEMIQLHLSSAGAPLDAAYSQHDGGERCDWIHVQRTSDGHPIVYVAVGSHASFFSSGTHVLPAGDYVDGNVHIDPLAVDVSTAPGWLAWPGIWGASGASPKGPEYHDSQWNHALDWENGVSGCTEGQTYGRALYASTKRNITSPRSNQAPAPPVPKLSATLVNGQVHLSYKFPVMPTGIRRPWQLLVSVKPLSLTRPALTKWVPVRSSSGVVVQDARPIHGAFRILVTVFTRKGGHSPLLTVPLQGH
jgi:Vacuolar protein sorting-associated protein 62